MIDKLLIYLNFLDDDIIRDADSYATSKDEKLRYKILREIFRRSKVSPFAYEEYLESKLLSSVNEFSLACEKYGSRALDNEYLIDMLKNDIDIIKNLFSLSVDKNNMNNKPGPIATRYLGSSNDGILKQLSDKYFKYGCGELSLSEAYFWKDGIENIYTPDPVVFDDLIGYEWHKKKIINNTKSFLEGKQYNNILLFGDRGTGKSSCAKAAFNMFKDQRLRIIELSKRNISKINDLMDFIRNRGFKFILFLDDLSFEETEYEYKELKSHLEGGLLMQPENVVIYATSNRFHIVKEQKAENYDQVDDLHRNDAVQEKLSLSDRFGITITFDTPTPKEYINIVKKLLDRHGIYADAEKIKTLAYRWELANHGRSGRSAIQFVKTVLDKIDDDVILDEDG